MNMLCWGVDTVLQALLTPRMGKEVLFTNFRPVASVFLFRFPVSVILLIVAVVIFLMLRTEPGMGQSRASGMITRMGWLRWHWL